MTHDRNCEHNDHSHMFIWVVLFLVCINSQCTDCTGEKRQQTQDINDLKSKVQLLENKCK